MNITLSQRIAQLNRRHYKAAIVRNVKGTLVVLAGIASWAVLAGLVNYIR